MEKVLPCQSNVAEFQRIFTKAYQDLQESSTTEMSRGCANYASQESTALEARAQLANTATADRTTMENLNAQVQYLQEENIKLQEKTLAELERLAVSERPTASGRTPRKVRFGYYCWACIHHSNHKGKDCKFNKERHQIVQLITKRWEEQHYQQSHIVDYQVVLTERSSVVLITK